MKRMHRSTRVLIAACALLGSIAGIVTLAQPANAVNSPPTFTAATPPSSAIVGVPYGYTYTASGTPAPTFSVAGGLPNGLSLNATSGLLSGTPTTAGSFTFTATASNGVLPNATGPVTTINVGTPPVFTADTPPTTAALTVPYTYTYTATGNPAPTFAVSSGSLPNGLTLNSISGVLSGTPTSGGAFTFTVTASNTISPPATGPSTTITVSAPVAPAFTADTPPNAVVGSAYSYTYTATGNPAPTFSVSSGVLPTGLTLNPVSGVLSGTPTPSGTFTFTVTAANGVGPAAVSPSTTVVIGIPPTFTADTPPSSASLTVPYTYTYTASGNPGPTFSVSSGALPPGLLLNVTTGVLSGTPTTLGTFTFTVTASNGVGSPVTSPSTTITVSNSPLFTADTPPTTAAVGVAYNYTYAASGTPAPTFSVSSGSLPTGLTLNPVSGVLSGTPTTPGAFTFTVTAANGFTPNAVSPSTTITVAAPVAPVFTADTPPTTAAVGVPYSYTYTATGNPAPTFAVTTGTLPAGLSLDATSGVLSGTPTVPQTRTFKVTASNGVGPAAASPSTTITVGGTGAPVFTADTPPTTAAVGVAYAYTYAATGSPAPTFAVSGGALPTGLSLNATSGLLSGTPTTAGAFTFTVTATNGVSPDAIGPATTITVSGAGAPVFTANTPPTTAAVGVAYSYTYAANGTPAPTFAVTSGSLPTGLSLNATSGLLSGTPTTTGAFTFTVTASNGVLPNATGPSTTITVSGPVAPVFTADTPPTSGTVGVAYAYSYAATGTPAPTFAVASGSLPSGLSLNSTSGLLSGTPTAAGVFTFTVTAANGVNPAATSPSTTITIGAAPPPPPPPPPPATTGYWLVASDGGIFSFGNAKFFGSTGGTHLNQPIVGMASTPDSRGYWLVASDGGIFAYGDAAFFGSTGATPLNKPIVGMASTPDGGGYWLVASDGGIFAFGDAGFYGSTGAIHLNQPVVGMAPTPNGRGYWMVASDGGIFAFGNAGFFGSMGGSPLNKPIVGMDWTPSGHGYWMVASDGGIFAFGDAGFFGSTGNIHLNQPVVGMTSTNDGGGYWFVASDGGIFAYGDAPFNGSMGGSPLNKPIVGISAT